MKQKSFLHSIYYEIYFRLAYMLDANSFMARAFFHVVFFYCFYFKIQVWTKRGLLITDPIELGLRVVEISLLTEPALQPQTTSCNSIQVRIDIFSWQDT